MNGRTVGGRRGGRSRAVLPSHTASEASGFLARSARCGNLTRKNVVRYIRVLSLVATMATPTSPPADLPEPGSLGETFDVYEVEVTDDGARYYGELEGAREAVEQRLATEFRDRGYRVRLARETGEHVLVATERSTTVEGIPWLNVVLFLATVATTMFAGTQWYGYGLDAGALRLLSAWPFAVAVLSVLAIHEFGHYVASRYHDVEATLPYFIPVPTALGTLGAIIRMKGHIPDREALFDIGVAGPLAGLVATVVVTIIGFTLDPVTVPERLSSGGAQYAIDFHDPLLMQGLEALVVTLGWAVEYGPGESINPVVFAGWAGMFFTFLNLLPVGQLDGGHIVRAIVGQRQETIAAAVPGGLFVLAGLLYFTRDAPPIGFGVWTLWVFWGLLATGLAYAGPARPTRDEPLDPRRTALGVLTFGLGVACFTPVPFEIVAA